MTTELGQKEPENLKAFYHMSVSRNRPGSAAAVMLEICFGEESRGVEGAETAGKADRINLMSLSTALRWC